jgi:exonuclease III
MTARSGRWSQGPPQLASRRLSRSGWSLSGQSWLRDTVRRAAIAASVPRRRVQVNLDRYSGYQAVMGARHRGMRLDFVLGSPGSAKTRDQRFIDTYERAGKGASHHAAVIVDLDWRRVSPAFPCLRSTQFRAAMAP